MTTKKLKRKDPAAVALGRKGGLARLTKMTREQRQEVSRRGAAVRNGQALPKQGPIRWYVVFSTDDPEQGELLFASRIKEEARTYARKVGRPLDNMDYNPTGFRMVREFKPDPRAQVEALGTTVKKDDQ